jgi:hypothetical protein
LVNRAAQPVAARAFLLLTAGGEWLSAGVFELPVPVPANASIAFAVDDFPGLAQRGPEADGDSPVETQAFATGLPSTVVVEGLAPEVTGFEVIGSRLYLRGRVSGPAANAFLHPTVLASLLSADGDLLSAGWTSAGDRIAVGGANPFLLVLPVPDGVDLASAEWDVSAIGVQE